MEKENANNTNNSYVEIRLSDFWKAFRRCWWLLLAALILVTGVTYLFMDRTHVDQYQSTVTIYVLPTDSKTQSNNYQQAMYALAIINDCEKLILSEDNVIIPAINRLAGTEYSETELKTRINSILKKVSVKGASSDSRLIYITVTSGTADGAAKVANAIALSATEYLNDLFRQDVANITDAAKVPKNISNPVSITKAGLFGVAAAALVYLIWLVVLVLDDRIDSEAHVEKYLGMTVLGAIPYQGQGARRRKNRYGSYSGYYGYGYGYALEQKSQDDSSASAKEANK